MDIPVDHSNLGRFSCTGPAKNVHVSGHLVLSRHEDLCVCVVLKRVSQKGKPSGYTAEYIWQRECVAVRVLIPLSTPCNT